MDLDGFPLLPILTATIAAFALGFVWYSLLFGKIWMKEVGLTPESMKGSNMALIFGTTLLLTFIMSTGVAVLVSIDFFNTITWRHGLGMGLLAGLVFVATSTGINYLYQRKSFRLWLIDAGYQVCFMGLVGAIIGAWR